MAAKIDDLLRIAAGHSASDLHLKVSAFPVMRIGGELHPVADAPRLKQEDTLDMGIGPVPAIRALLKRQGLTLDEIDLIELNEAFAAQVIACDRELGFDKSRLNVNGGAIALGHPIGCTGVRITTTLLHEMDKRSARLGLSTLCVSGGMGLALLVERV